MKMYGNSYYIFIEIFIFRYYSIGLLLEQYNYKYLIKISVYFSHYRSFQASTDAPLWKLISFRLEFLSFMIPSSS
jgi:hypothetical protein